MKDCLLLIRYRWLWILSNFLGPEISYWWPKKIVGNSTVKLFGWLVTGSLRPLATLHAFLEWQGMIFLNHRGWPSYPVIRLYKKTPSNWHFKFWAWCVRKVKVLERSFFTRIIFLIIMDFIRFIWRVLISIFFFFFLLLFLSMTGFNNNIFIFQHFPIFLLRNVLVRQIWLVDFNPKQSLLFGHTYKWKE